MGNGKIVQIIGTVVDVEFPPDQLPNLFDALEVDNQGERLILEVQAHVGNNWVRCLAMGATDGLARGSKPPIPDRRSPSRWARKRWAGSLT